EEIEELLLGKDELERVLLAAILGAGLAAAAALAGGRPLDRVADDEFLVAGDDVVAPAAGRGAVEHRLGDAAGRDRDFLAAVALTHLAPLQRVGKRTFHFAARPIDEALPIGEALAFRIGPSIDDIHRAEPSVVLSLACLVDAHVPLDKAADLALRVAARHHALEEVAMLLLGIGVFLRAEADDREQILDLREHSLLDHFAQFLIGRPRWVLAAVGGA